MSSAELSRGVEKVASERVARGVSSARGALDATRAVEADSFEDVLGKWQAAIVAAEQNRPKAASRQT